MIPFDSGIQLEALIDCSLQPPQYSTKYSATGRMVRIRIKREIGLGIQLQLNGRDMILWRWKSSVFATETHCPHQGSALLLGDLEEVGEQLCVTCPAHCWHFNLVTGSHSESPPSCRKMETFPTFVHPETQRVFVLFANFHTDLFRTMEW